jgi:undecaprenyl-phosphate 4-deoxy-4-formamido-L-arabinose transferase
MSTVSYSVVIPVFNAENSLDALHAAICRFFESGNYAYEIIYVNDSSIDNSWEVLKKIKQSNAPVTIINFSKNFGQHAATMCGFKYAKGDFVITLDDDLEAHPEEIEKLITAQKRSKADLVYGLYKKLNQSALRKFLTGFYKMLSKVEGKNKCKGSSFRLLTKALSKKLSDNHKHFVFIDELCLWYTTNIDFVETQSNPDFIDKRRYSISSLFSLTSNLIMFSSTYPLKLVTNIGISLATVNFCIGFYFLIKKLFFKISYSGYASLIVSILFSTGLIIFCIGILAQYISKLLKTVNNAPSYSESEVIC